MNQIEPLGIFSILLLIIPIAIVCAMSAALGLGQIKKISIASARSLVQLVAVGLIIGTVFAYSTWYWIILLLAVMTLIAGFTAASQIGVKISHLGSLLSLILGAVTAGTLFFIIRAVIGEGGWDPRYWIPLGGMLLGNSMTAATLAVERLGSQLAANQPAVETYLALGGAPRQAAHRAVRQAVNAALTPTINSMLIVGIVKLPGMMTGQMLGGTKPFQAALYQLLILIAILFCAAVSAFITSELLQRRFFTGAWQLNQSALSKFED